MKPDMEDGIFQRREFDLIDRSLQALLFQPLQTRPIRPEETAGADIAETAGLEDVVPMNDSLSGNVDISICDARQPQTERPLFPGDSAMHPSMLGAAIADDSRVKDR